jgi:hypothetical protein
LCLEGAVVVVIDAGGGLQDEVTLALLNIAVDLLYSSVEDTVLTRGGEVLVREHAGWMGCSL